MDSMMFAPTAFPFDALISRPLLDQLSAGLVAGHGSDGADMLLR
jgi:hypothetical protein